MRHPSRIRLTRASAMIQLRGDHPGSVGAVDFRLEGDGSTPVKKDNGTMTARDPRFPLPERTGHDRRGVTDMARCVDVMEEALVLLRAGDFRMAAPPPCPTGR